MLAAVAGHNLFPREDRLPQLLMGATLVVLKDGGICPKDIERLSIWTWMLSMRPSKYW
jgi:hypothetical protein